MKNPYSPIKETEMKVPRTPMEELLKSSGCNEKFFEASASLYNRVIECYGNITKLKSVLAELDVTSLDDKSRVNGLVALIQERVEDFAKECENPDFNNMANAIYDVADEMGI